MHHERIAIIDFGSQYTRLITRRLRELGAFGLVYGSSATAAEIAGADLKGVILSGGPNSVLEPGAPPRELSRLDSKNWTPTPAEVEARLCASVRALWSALAAASSSGFRIASTAVPANCGRPAQRSPPTRRAARTWLSPMPCFAKSACRAQKSKGASSCASPVPLG